MGSQPLTPGGGRADRLGFRLARGEAAQLDELARRRGYQNRSELVRSLIAELLAGAERSNEEDASRAS